MKKTIIIKLTNKEILIMLLNEGIKPFRNKFEDAAVAEALVRAVIYKLSSEVTEDPIIVKMAKTILTGKDAIVLIPTENGISLKVVAAEKFIETIENKDAIMELKTPEEVKTLIDQISQSQ